tara:strand:- start:939 stop:1139 length:201 start_codon:yes stop_codon:yes gene_type:complete
LSELEPKHILKSKTAWLGFGTVALAMFEALQLLDLPEGWAAVVGALVVVLRSLTTQPVVLKGAEEE